MASLLLGLRMGDAIGYGHGSQRHYYTFSGSITRCRVGADTRSVSGLDFIVLLQPMRSGGHRSWRVSFWGGYVDCSDRVHASGVDRNTAKASLLWGCVDECALPRAGKTLIAVIFLKYRVHEVFLNLFRHFHCSRSVSILRILILIHFRSLRGIAGHSVSDRRSSLLLESGPSYMIHYWAPACLANDDIVPVK